MASTVTSLGRTLRQMERLFEGDSGSVVGLDDAALWERFARCRDEQAFEALVKRHGPMVLHTARAILGDHHSAEDVLQTTFVALARRGTSIRQFATLAPWLHRVASREAVRLRARTRRQLDRERRLEPRSGDQTGRTCDEIGAAVHAELNRLPESYRVPIVLCDLEGWTKASAAVHLGWTEGAVRGRLERGRLKLRDRLTRQGFAPAAGTLATALGWNATASAATQIAPRLIAATTRAALAVGPVGWVGGLTSALVANRLSSGLIRTSLITIGLAGSVGLVGAMGWTWLNRLAPTAPVPPGALGRTTPPSAPAPTPMVPAVGPEKPGDLVELMGQVIAPDGRPVGGARVRLKPHVTMLPRPGETSVTAGADGRFTLPVARHLLGPLEYESAIIAAQAPGWGLGYVAIGKKPLAASDRLMIRLVADDAPLDGRIIDLEGKPVAGASVRVSQLVTPATPDLTAWADTIRRTGVWAGSWPAQDATNARQMVDLGIYPDLATTTDPDGRFQLTGLGRERLVSLVVAAPHLATTEFHATTQTRGPIVTFDRNEPSVPITIPANRLALTLAPGQTVLGVIRDAETGLPIAGMALKGKVFDENGGNVWLPGIEAVSDEQGRYRLDGFPVASRYTVFVRPTRGQPYLSQNIPTLTEAQREAQAQKPEAGERAMWRELSARRGGRTPADLTLRRGVVVRGRVTNKATGEPVVNASVQTYPKRDNPELARYPHLDRLMSFCRTDTNGIYEVVTLPGTGLVGVFGLSSTMKTSGLEQMEGYDPKRRGLRDYPAANNLMFASAVALIQPEVGSRPTLDFAVESGSTLRGTVVGPDGKPLVGTRFCGGTTHGWPQAVSETGSFEIKGLDPSRPGRYVFFQAEQRLAAEVMFRGDEAEPVVVRLAQSGSVSGRLIDERGEPVGGAKLVQWRDDVEMPGQGRLLDGEIAVGEDGRFRVDGLIPGLLYRLHASRGPNYYGGKILNDFAPQADVTTDLGDIKMATPPAN